MKHYQKRLLLTVALTPLLGLNAQIIYPDIVIKYPHKGDLVKYFPWSIVRVIDSRVDTTKIYTLENCIYPPRHANFNEPATAVIKKYIDSSIRESKKGAGELLINIEQLSIANIHYNLRRHMSRLTRYKWLVRKSKRGEVVSNTRPRVYVQWQATAWYKNEQGSYNKLMTINKKTGHTNYQFDKYVMSRLVGETVKTLALIDPDTVTKEKNIPFEQINVNVRNRWKVYEVIRENASVAGIAYAFDDFRKNSVAPANIQLLFNSKDSLYYLQPGGDSLFRRKPHWGVCDGAIWYFKFADSSYFKLNRQGDTYMFYIPRTLPDMHALLSIEENKVDASSSPNVNAGGQGNFLVALAAVLISGAIDAGVNNSLNNHTRKWMTAAGLKHNYRYCTFNMDNGDIIYQDK